MTVYGFYKHSYFIKENVENMSEVNKIIEPIPSADEKFRKVTRFLGILYEDVYTEENSYYDITRD